MTYYSVHEYEELKAENERLRETLDVYKRDIFPMIDNLSRHQAAAAEIRQEARMGAAKFNGTAGAHYDFILRILDNLPRDGA